MGARYGKIVGHEPAGIVIQTGNAVSKFKVGDRVTVNHTLGCGHCQYCHQGETVLCLTGKGTALADVGPNTNVLKLLENACLELPENISLKTVLLSRVPERLHTMRFKNYGSKRFAT